jgi:hypothetical protein
VTRFATGAAALLHLGLEHVPPTVRQAVTNGLLKQLEQGIVAVVVLLDELKRPSPRDDVAPDQLAGVTPPRRAEGQPSR